MTSAVPRSGCAATSRTARGPDPHHGPGRGAQAEGELRPRRDHRRRVQDERELHELRGLELQRPGAEPAARAVDLHAEAGDQHEQQQDERDQQQVRRVAPHRGEALARDQLHQHEPDGAVDEVLDQVGGAVAVALQQRARARGRVDHHRAAREQAEGCGEQQPVLERLLLLASGHQALFSTRPLPHPPRARGNARRAPRSRRTGRTRRTPARAARPRRAAPRRAPPRPRARGRRSSCSGDAGRGERRARAPARSRRSGRRRGRARPPGRRAARSRRPCRGRRGSRGRRPSKDSSPATAEATFVALESLT